MTKQRRKATGVYDEKSVKIGIHAWNLDSVEKAMNLIIKEAMAIATKEYACYAWFPRAYAPGDGLRNRKIYSDPTLIKVELPLGECDGEGPVWTFTLTDLVEGAIEMGERGDGGPIDEKEKPNLIAIRDRLRKLADTIDMAIDRPDPDAPRRYA